MQYGCIGEKLSHSFSKIIHNKLCDYSYELKELTKQELDAFMRKRDFKAINVTIPYKQDVIPYLDFVSDVAKKIGAVNTIVNRCGKLYGYNTDYSGMTALIKQSGIIIENKKVLILGGGGTSKTALNVAYDLGAKSIFRISRSEKEGLITYDEAYNLHSDADILINTTPCGMFPNIGVAAVDVQKFEKLSGVIDAVYNPLRSQLVINAQKQGITAVGGLYMLVAQAVFAAQKFSDKAISKYEINRIYSEVLNSTKNIVLIGMPGCGKSTIGKRLSKILNKDFIDTDDEIVKQAGKSISEIFSEVGEKGFREIESEVIKQLAVCKNTVIATGGGAVLNGRNIDYLKANGITVFIDRPIEHLVTTDDRPLSKTRELLEKRFNERYEIYKNSADFVINAVENIETNINNIKTEFLKCEF